MKHTSCDLPPGSPLSTNGCTTLVRLCTNQGRRAVSALLLHQRSTARADDRIIRSTGDEALQMKNPVLGVRRLILLEPPERLRAGLLNPRCEGRQLVGPAVTIETD
jgi:hypothetical protein